MCFVKAHRTKASHGSSRSAAACACTWCRRLLNPCALVRWLLLCRQVSKLVRKHCREFRSDPHQSAGLQVMLADHLADLLPDSFKRNAMLADAEIICVMGL